MEFTIRRQYCDLITNLTHSRKINTCVFLFTVLLWAFDGLPLRVNPILWFEIQILTLLISLIQNLQSFFINVWKCSFGNALVDKLTSVNISHRVHILDDSIHEWLSKWGLIKLVMSHLAIANEVNHDITSESLTVRLKEFFLDLDGTELQWQMHLLHRPSSEHSRGKWARWLMWPPLNSRCLI